MARELVIEARVESVEAEAAVARLALAFTKAGDSADVAATKAEKFKKSYEDGGARRKAKDELDALNGSTDKVASSTDKLSAAVMRYAGPAVVLAAARSTVDWADDIAEMAQRTHLSTTAVQQLTKVAEKNGSTFGVMAGLIQQSEQRLTSHNKQAEAAVKLMGLAPEALLRMDPLDRLRAIAKGLADIKDPAQKSAAEMAVFGRAADAAAPALLAVAAGADKLEDALGPGLIRAGAQVQDMLDDLTNKAMDAVRAFFLLPAAIGNAAGQMGKDSLLGTAFEMAGFHGSRASTMPGLPGAPGAPFMPTAAGAIDQLGGNSQAFIKRALRLPAGRATGGGRVLPFRQSTFAGGSAAAAAFMMANTPGPFAAGSLPFMSSPGGLLGSGAGPISFANGSGLAGAVGMNAPGGGGIGGFLGANKGRLGMLAGGLAAQFLPGRVGQVAQGAMGMAGQGAGLGAMFGPHGAAIGAGIGALVGGVSSLFGGGKAKKNAANQEKSDVFAQFSTDEFKKMQNQAERFGISMDKALSAKTMKDFSTAVEEVNGKLKTMTDLQDQIDSLTEQSTVGFDKMNAVVKEFGLDIGKMGPAFQQASADKEIQKIVDALAIMEKGGADMNGVLDGMQDEISKVVQDSLKFGTTIPENMKPWIEKLKESGRLVDENGQAITDTSKLNFAAPMVSEMDKVVKKLDELIQKLADLARGFGDAGRAAGDLPSGVPSGGGSNTDGGGPDGFATGGVAGRDFRRPGYGDVFPALLRRGERVMPAGVGGSGISIGNITVNGGYGRRSEAVEDIGNAVVAYIERRGGRLVA